MRQNVISSRYCPVSLTTQHPLNRSNREHDIELSESLLSIELHTSQAGARLYVPHSLATGSLGRLARHRWTTKIASQHWSVNHLNIYCRSKSIPLKLVRGFMYPSLWPTGQLGRLAWPRWTTTTELQSTTKGFDFIKTVESSLQHSF